MYLSLLFLSIQLKNSGDTFSCFLYLVLHACSIILYFISSEQKHRIKFQKKKYAYAGEKGLKKSFPNTATFSIKYTLKLNEKQGWHARKLFYESIKFGMTLK